MAENTNPIKYSDLVMPDNSITTLIEQLTQLSETYKTMLKDLRTEAQAFAQTLKGVSGATEQGRKTTEEAAQAAENLRRKTDEVKKAEAQNSIELQRLKQAEREKNQIDKLTAKLISSKAGSYDRLSAQYALNKIRLNAMSDAERKAEKTGKALETETRKIYEEMKRLQEATGKYQLNVGNYANSFKSAIGVLGGATIGIGSVAAAGMAAVGAMKEGIGTAQDFEHALSVLEAISGKTEKQLQGLKDQARELGATTIYTATEVTELQIELAKLGYSISDIENMTSSVLYFAQATGASLADAASLAGAALRMFGADTTHTAEYVDMMSAATTKSALSFGYLQTAMSIVSPVANAFGFNIQDVLALLGQLANAGFDASSAATATRNILLNLADANGKLAQRLGQPVKSLDDLLDGLIRLNLSEQELAESLELTDKRSVAAYRVFLQGAQNTRELRDAINEATGAAEQMAQTMGDDLTGDVKALGSAWDDFMIELNNGQSFLRSAVQALTDFVRGVSSVYKDVRGYFEELYDQSKVIRYMVEQLGVSFTSTWAGIKAILKIAFDTFSNFGRLIKGVFTLDWNEIKAAYAQGVKDLIDTGKEYATTLAQSQANANEAIKNGNKEIVEEIEETAAEVTNVVISQGAQVTQITEAQYKKQLQLLRKYQDAQLESETDEFAKRRKKTQYQYDRQIEDLTYQLAHDKDLTAAGRKAITDTIVLLKQQEADALNRINQDEAIAELQAQKKVVDLRLKAAAKGTQEEYDLKMQALELDKQIALKRNALLPEAQRQSEADIIASFNATSLKLRDAFMQSQLEQFDKAQELAQSEFDLLRNSEERKTRFRLQAEKERLKKVLELNKTAGNQLSDVEVQTILNTIAKIDQEIERSEKAERGADIYGLFGLNLDNEQKQAINSAYDFAVGQLNDFMAKQTQAAEQAVKNAEKEVQAAQKKLDAERTARANGYAADVESAQKELDLARKTQEKAQREQAKAQRAQEAVQAVQQAGNLVTASSMIWSQLGFPWAIPAIAVMWGSFAAAKIKAAQVTRKTEKYGEGTIELLQGGSHQSGNDIAFGTKPDGTERRAEGGEFFAVINKRNSRKYRRVIPDVIKSLNNGTFANKYLQAYSGGEGLTLNISGNAPDIRELNANVRSIKEQSQKRIYADGRGNMVQQYKNLKRTFIQ